jgi:hypothetical protein
MQQKIKSICTGSLTIVATIALAACQGTPTNTPPVAQPATESVPRPSMELRSPGLEVQVYPQSNEDKNHA